MYKVLNEFRLEITQKKRETSDYKTKLNAKF